MKGSPYPSKVGLVPLGLCPSYICYISLLKYKAEIWWNSVDDNPKQCDMSTIFNLMEYFSKSLNHQLHFTHSKHFTKITLLVFWLWWFHCPSIVEKPAIRYAQWWRLSAPFAWLSLKWWAKQCGLGSQWLIVIFPGELANCHSPPKKIEKPSVGYIQLWHHLQ